jgi:hypothetical protein
MAHPVDLEWGRHPGFNALPAIVLKVPLELWQELLG